MHYIDEDDVLYRDVCVNAKLVGGDMIWLDMNNHQWLIF